MSAAEPVEGALDAVDRRMLDVLQREGRITNAELAERLHLSPSPCLRRLRALERRGLVTGYGARVDRAKLGLDITVFVELKLNEHSGRVSTTIAETLLATPEVLAAHVVSGSADILLEAAVPDLAAYERLLFDVLLDLPGVTDVRSNFALRTIKASAPVPT